MRCIFACGKATSTADAVILVNHCFGDIIKIKILPIGRVGDRSAHKVLDAFVPFFIHPLRQTRDHFLHNLETISHRRGANLDVAAAERDVFSRIPPCCDPTNT